MKKFLIIGSTNAIKYKGVFPLLKDNQVWLGYVANKGMAFVRPDGSLKSVNICWYTNLNRTGPKNIKTLSKKYDPELYPKYDNYDVIEVGKINDIPIDYGGAMGVPITFFAWDQYNVEFEILGIASPVRWLGYECITKINGKNLFERVLIKNKKVQK